MSPATCNADLMKITTDKWDALIPKGLKYDSYTSDGLDALENWLKEMQSFVLIKRMQLEEMEEFEKERLWIEYKLQKQIYNPLYR